MSIKFYLILSLLCPVLSQYCRKVKICQNDPHSISSREWLLLICLFLDAVSGLTSIGGIPKTFLTYRTTLRNHFQKFSNLNQIIWYNPTYGLTWTYSVSFHHFHLFFCVRLHTINTNNNLERFFKIQLLSEKNYKNL